MASTSASELLARCLAGEQWDDELLLAALNEDEGRAFFSVVVERLGDLFEPGLCDTYARLFARVMELVRPEYEAAALLARYDRVRQVRHCKQDPRNVFVLSRVTLGADVAVTSVLLNAAKRRFPDAAIWFVGSHKNYELFANDSRVAHLAWPYPRAGSLIERLQRIPRIPEADAIVIDTDSRLTQLGMLPVCAEDRHYLFESRAYGGDGDEALPLLAARWAEDVFGVSGLHAYIAPAPAQMPFDVAVSFGVGDNEEKRLGDTFERALLEELVRRGVTVVLDTGAGGREMERATSYASAVRGVRLYHGPYAPFASMISQARFYVGYDSAGQHVAAAAGTPLATVFAGFPSERFYSRWRPHGPGPSHVVKVTDRTPETVLAQVVQNLTL